MGRITETSYSLVGVTMATVYVAEEKNTLMDVGKQSSFRVSGTWM